MNTECALRLKAPFILPEILYKDVDSDINLSGL